MKPIHLLALLFLAQGCHSPNGSPPPFRAFAIKSDDFYRTNVPRNGVRFVVEGTGATMGSTVQVFLLRRNALNVELPNPIYVGSAPVLPGGLFKLDQGFAECGVPNNVVAAYYQIEAKDSASGAETVGLRKNGD